MAAQTGLLPPGFVDLNTAYNEKRSQPCNVIGVCVDHLDVAPSRGTDYTIKFILHDVSWSEGVGMPCRFFHLDSTKLPRIQANGDVFLIRNVKVMQMGRMLTAISNRGTSWIVIPQEYLNQDRPHSGPKMVFLKSSPHENPSQAELEYAKRIWQNEDHGTWSRKAAPTSLQTGSAPSYNLAQPASKPKEKYSLVKDLDIPSHEQMIFVDLLGEVRRMYTTPDRVDLFISDYTPHESLYHYEPGCDDDIATGDQYGYIQSKKTPWPGPWGQQTMSVALWDAHFTFAKQNVRPGTFVLLSNVHITMDKNDKTLEGKCRGDRRFPDKVNVAVFRAADANGNPPLVDLLKRKRKYEELAERRSLNFIRDPLHMKKKPEKSVGREKSEKTSKEMKKSRKRKFKGLEETDNLTIQQMGGKGEKPLNSRLNENIRCDTHEEVAVTPISNILDPVILGRKTAAGSAFELPFQNASYKVQIRIVDFFPPKLEDFCVPYSESQYDAVDEGEDDNDSHFQSGSSDSASTPDSDEEVQWKWRFMLLVQDKEKNPNTGRDHQRHMDLLVADEDGDYLLNQDPCDLRTNPKELQKLRETLFKLWGDLEEQKEDANSSEAENGKQVKASGRPFQCYVKEYGVRVSQREDEDDTYKGWQRMFRLWGTTVK